MKVVTYAQGCQTAVGILKKDGTQVVPVQYLGCTAQDMTEFIKELTVKKLEKLTRNVELMEGFSIADVHILSPSFVQNKM